MQLISAYSFLFWGGYGQVLLEENLWCLPQSLLYLTSLLVKKKKYPYFLTIYFIFIYVCVYTGHVPRWGCQITWNHCDTSKVGAGSWTWALWKRSICFELLSHLFSSYTRPFPEPKAHQLAKLTTEFIGCLCSPALEAN